MRQILSIGIITACCYVAGCNKSVPPSPIVEAAQIQSSSPSGVDPAFIDQKIALSFPRAIGGLNFVEHYPYSEAAFGYSVRYENENEMKIDVYVYNAGRNDISSGHTGEEIAAELGAAESAIRHYEEHGAYRNVEKLGGGVYPPSATDKDVAFQSSRYRFSQSARPDVVFTGLRVSETFIRGFKGHFLKVRVTYPEESAEESIKARDLFLQQLAALIAAASLGHL